METILLKKCSTCQQEFGLDSFYPQMTRCKSCHIRAGKQRRHEKRPELAKKARKREEGQELLRAGFQKCIKCETVKPATTEYFFKGRKPDSLEKRCKICRVAANREAGKRPEVQERRREYSRRWRRDLPAERRSELSAKRLEWRRENKEADAASQKRWYVKHASEQISRRRQYYIANKEKCNMNSKAWRLANPLAYRASQHAARARKRNAEGTYTADDIKRQLGSQSGKCYWCGEKISFDGSNKLTVDHLIALSRGGTNLPNNIVCACKTCNVRKWANTPWEFNGRLL